MPANIGPPSRSRNIRFSRNSSLTRRDPRRSAEKGLWRNSPRVRAELMVGTSEGLALSGLYRSRALAAFSRQLSPRRSRRALACIDPRLDLRAPPVTPVTLFWQSEGAHHALVSLPGILPRGR